MKFAEGPECDPQAGQKSRKDCEPCKYVTAIAGIVAGITIMSRTRDAESAKAEETTPARGAAVDFAAHHKG
jgi:hypothetical protein